MLRAFAVWLLIMLAESIHGTLRTLYLAPLVGDLRARRISFFTGTLLIFAVAFLSIRWIRAATTRQLLSVGLLWLVLTALFEFSLGLFVLGYSWGRMFEDYDVARGGLMGFGLLFMLLAPALAARARGHMTSGRTRLRAPTK